jgi:hypothetical protein
MDDLHPDSPLGRFWAERTSYRHHNEDARRTFRIKWPLWTGGISAYITWQIARDSPDVTGIPILGFFVVAVFVGTFAGMVLGGNELQDPMAHVDPGPFNLAQCRCLDCNPDKRWALEQEHAAWLQHQRHQEQQRLAAEWEAFSADLSQRFEDWLRHWWFDNLYDGDREDFPRVRGDYQRWRAANFDLLNDIYRAWEAEQAHEAGWRFG